MRVGSSGTGHLDISQGGRVTSASSVIGLFSGSNGTVNINGFNLVNGFQSTWTATGLFDVGDGGSGTINVTNSGELRTNSATLGVRAGGFGNVLVAGTPITRRLVTNGNVSVGPTGTGILTLADQAKLEFTGTGGSLIVGANGTFNFGYQSSHGIGAPGSIVGAVSIVNNGTINLDHTGTVTWTTPITGPHLETFSKFFEHHPNGSLGIMPAPSDPIELSLPTDLGSLAISVQRTSTLDHSLADRRLRSDV